MTDAGKNCFFIAPIGHEGSDTRKRSDEVLKYIVEPAAIECNYSVTRADRITEPGIITHQVIQRVLNDDLVIADLTGHNANVFYELAIRHATKKPFVQIIDANDTIPFDIANQRTIIFRHDSLSDADRARQEIINQIKSIIQSSGAVETPIDYAFNFANFETSGGGDEKALALIMNEISTIRREMAEIRAVSHAAEQIVQDRDRAWSMRRKQLEAAERAARKASFREWQERREEMKLDRMLKDDIVHVNNAIGRDKDVDD